MNSLSLNEEEEQNRKINNKCSMKKICLIVSLICLTVLICILFIIVLVGKNDIKVTINKIDKENIELKKRIEVLNNKIENELKLNINPNELKKETDIIIKKLKEELKIQIDNLKNENKELKIEVNKINIEKEELKANITQINNELKNENGNGNEELKNQIDNLKIENEELKKRINNLDNSLLDKIQAIEKESEELKNKTNLIENEKNDLKNRTNKIEEESSKLKDKIEGDKNELKKSINELSNKNNYLEKNITNIENEKNDLKNRANKIEEESSKLKEKIEGDKNELKKSIDELGNENNYLENKIIDIENEKNERNKYYRNLFTDSNIIKEDERKLISKWILPHYKLKFELLYRGTRDGFDPMAFHSRCDNKGPTLFVAKLSNDRRLGGFTRKFWDLKIVGKIDERAFLFSLDNKIKFGQIKNGQDVILGKDNCSINFGPNGGADELSFVGKDVYCRGGTKFTFEQSELCGEFKTQLKEMEVYSVKNYL